MDIILRIHGSARHSLLIMAATVLLLASGKAWCSEEDLGQSPLTYTPPDLQKLQQTLEHSSASSPLTEQDMRFLTEQAHAVEVKMIETPLDSQPEGGPVSPESQNDNSPVPAPQPQVIQFQLKFTPAPATPPVEARWFDTDLALSPGDIESCGQISEPGTYTLTGDIQADSTMLSCLDIHDTTDVHIECNGHHIGTGSMAGSRAMTVWNIQGVSITGCEVDGPLTVVGARQLLLTNNTLTSLNAADCQDSDVTQNEITGSVPFPHYVDNHHNPIDGPAIELDRDSNMRITDNQISHQGGTGDALIEAIEGHGNVFARNTMDGGWDASQAYPATVGTDDGLMLRNDTGDWVFDNQIRNVWDCGIETIGQVSDLMISGNTIDHAQQAAVGTWWNSSWDRVTIQNNTATNTQTFLDSHFQAQPDMSIGYGPLPTLPHFDDVHVTDNNLSSDPSVSSPRDDTSLKAFPAEIVDQHIPVVRAQADGGLLSIENLAIKVPVPFEHEGNTISGNNFDPRIPGPSIFPSDVFQDQGGNTWGPAPKPLVGLQTIVVRQIVPAAPATTPPTK